MPTNDDEAARFLEALGDGPLSLSAADDSQGRANWRPVRWTFGPGTRRGALVHAREKMAPTDALHVRPYHPNGQPNSPLGQCCVDLDAVRPDRLRAIGIEPAAVVETSPGRYQAWIRFPQPGLPEPEVRRLQIAIADDLGLEPGAKQARHAGRVPGYQNRKPGHPDHPPVRLLQASGAVADRAVLDQLIARVPAEPERAEPVRPVVRKPAPVGKTYPPKAVEEFHANPKYGGDKNRADMAWAIYAVDRMGLSVEEAGAAIDAARQGDHKGRGYGRRTAEKAARAIDADRNPHSR